VYHGLIPPGQAPHLIPWSPVVHQPLDDFRREESAPDVPLNLSKHAG
jgi:hypothetical protein